MKNNEQEKNERKLDNIINIVEKHTRTERHLEQYQDISTPENKQKAIEKQNSREKQIQELKGQIIGGKQNENKQEYELEDLKENYKIGINYYENVDKD